MVYRILLNLIVILLASGSITSQCYNLGFPGDISFDPADPIPGAGGMTTLTFTYTNFGKEMPLNENGGESISICYQLEYLQQVGEVYGSGADFYDEIEFLQCAFLNQKATIPTGEYEFKVDFRSLDDSSPEDNDGQGTHCVVVNLQPSGIHSGNSCFDPKDDFLSICTWADSVATPVIDPILNGLKMYPNPASEILFIEYTDSPNFSVDVFDVNGKKVMQTENKKSMDVRVLDIGFYLLRFHDLDADKMIYKKIEIAR